MGAGDSERRQMAASLRWYTNANADSHGNRNTYRDRYCLGNRYSYGFA